MFSGASSVEELLKLSDQLPAKPAQTNSGSRSPDRLRDSQRIRDTHIPLEQRLMKTREQVRKSSVRVSLVIESGRSSMQCGCFERAYEHVFMSPSLLITSTVGSHCIANEQLQHVQHRPGGSGLAGIFLKADRKSQESSPSKRQLVFSEETPDELKETDIEHWVGLAGMCK